MLAALTLIPPTVRGDYGWRKVPARARDRRRVARRFIAARNRESRRAEDGASTNGGLHRCQAVPAGLASRGSRAACSASTSSSRSRLISCPLRNVMKEAGPR